MEYFVWNIDPVLLHIGSLQLRWYSLLFVGAFFIGLLILQKIFQQEHKNPEILDTLLVYVMIGTVVGARLMHTLAYQPEYYLNNPLEILYVWKGGLASHGGLLGVLLALYIFAKRYTLSFNWLVSRIAIPGALAATMIRIGNFFNSEIVGIQSNRPWAVIFERFDTLPRHPVQLYEASVYLLLFFVLLLIYKKVSHSLSTKIIPGIFLSYVFTTRFFLEYLKTHQADYTTTLPFTTGQILSIPFILLGIGWILWSLKNKKTVSNTK